MQVTDKQLVVGPIFIPLLSFREIFILAVGKASALMMHAALRTLVDFRIRGILVAPKDQRIPKFDDRIELFLSGHPIPNQVGLRASQRVMQAVSGLAEDHLLLCLISGGASALLPAPTKGITIQDKIVITHQLISSGANIHEINTIRRHLSQLKGGRLVEMCRAREIVSMIISDVPGNHLPDIGSGLTVEDPTWYQDAVNILKRHNQWQETPLRVREHLRKGVRGTISETPKPGSASFQRVHNFIIADNEVACKAAERSFEERKMPCTILSTSAELGARDMGRLLAAFAAKMKPSSEYTCLTELS